MAAGLEPATSPSVQWCWPSARRQRGALSTELRHVMGAMVGLEPTPPRPYSHRCWLSVRRQRDALSTELHRVNLLKFVVLIQVRSTNFLRTLEKRGVGSLLDPAFVMERFHGVIRVQ